MTTLEKILAEYLTEEEVATVLEKNSEEFQLEYVFNSLCKEEQAKLAEFLTYGEMIVEQTQEDMVELLLDWYYPGVYYAKVFGLPLTSIIKGEIIIDELRLERKIFLLPNGTYLFVYSNED